jgi:hypothetical protein
MDDISYDEVVKFPSYWCREDEGSCDGRIGSVMIRSGSKARGMLVKLGYLEKTDLYDEVSICDVGEEMFQVYLSGEYSSFSEYKVVRDIPSWLNCVPMSL